MDMGTKINSLREKIQILDESTGHTRYIYSKEDSENEHDILSKDGLSVEDFIFSGDLNRKSCENFKSSKGGTKLGIDNSKVLVIELDSPSADQRILNFIDQASDSSTFNSEFNNPGSNNASNNGNDSLSPAKKTTVLNSSTSSDLSSNSQHQFFFNNHQNYSIMNREMTSHESAASTFKFKHHSAQLMTSSSTFDENNLANSSQSATMGRNRSKNSKIRKCSKQVTTSSTQEHSHHHHHQHQAITTSSVLSLKPVSSNKSAKEMATCQFCGRSMLKKNIPTHIRRAHTPKEELVCLNEEQNIFTLHHLRPGERRKRSARAYDYNLMTATVNIDDDPTEGIENKFITGEQILSTDLIQLADRIKYGIGEIPMSTLTKLIEILTKIEYSTEQETEQVQAAATSSLYEVRSNAKNIRNLIYYYLTAGDEFKYKIKQVSEDIASKKNLVNGLRADLKEVMSKKAHLERKIQPLVCELQRLEDQHGELIDSIVKESSMFQFEILTTEGGGVN